MDQDASRSEFIIALARVHDIVAVRVLEGLEFTLRSPVKFKRGVFRRASPPHCHGIHALFDLAENILPSGPFERLLRNADPALPG